jgi:hypothetical protein
MKKNFSKKKFATSFTGAKKNQGPAQDNFLRPKIIIYRSKLECLSILVTSALVDYLQEPSIEVPLNLDQLQIFALTKHSLL